MSRRSAARAKASPYDALVEDGLVSTEELQDCLRRAATQRRSPEQLLIAEHQVPVARIGAALARHFDVPYEPFQRGRVRSEALQGLLRREFVVEHGWMPLEESPDGLVVVCIDPEQVRAARVVPQVFARISKFAWRVTTATEFSQMLAQLYGGGEGGAIGDLLTDLSVPLDEDPDNDALLESAAADNEVVKFVNKLVVDAWQQRASDIHIEPTPGKGRACARCRSTARPASTSPC